MMIPSHQSVISILQGLRHTLEDSGINLAAIERKATAPGEAQHHVNRLILMQPNPYVATDVIRNVLENNTLAGCILVTEANTAFLLAARDYLYAQDFAKDTQTEGQTKAILHIASAMAHISIGKFLQALSGTLVDPQSVMDKYWQEHDQHLERLLACLHLPDTEDAP